jgi:RNA polymerase sigma-70 factor (ECF subfamily)
MHSAPITRPSLLLRIRESSNDLAWREFVEIYTPLLFAYGQRAGLQPADAADVAQEVLGIIARGANDFEYDPKRGRFRGWLLGVARNRVMKFQEQRRRHPLAVSPSSVERALEPHAAADDESQWDREYHQRLFAWAAEQVRREFEEKTWQAFWQTAVEDKSGGEVAKALGLSVGAVYIARSRVLSRLKQRVAEAMKGFGVEEEY